MPKTSNGIESRTFLMNRTVENSTQEALVKDILEILTDGGIRTKNMPRLRKHVTDGLLNWDRSIDGLIKVRNEVLERIQEDRAIWERITSP